MSSSERLYQQHAFRDLDQRFGAASPDAPAAVPQAPAPKTATPASSGTPSHIDDLDRRFGGGDTSKLARPSMPALRMLTTPTPAPADATTRAPDKPRDLQRDADPLERFLNLLSTPLYATSGAARGAVDRKYAPGPLEGAARGIREHHGYGDWIESAIPEEYRALRVPSFVPLAGGSMPVMSPDMKTLAHLAGLPLDVALDPVTYAGAGLSKTGELAKAEEIARRYTALHGVDDAARATAAAATPAYVEGAAAMPQRIRAGQEGLQFAGKVVAPEAQARAVEGMQALHRNLASWAPFAAERAQLTEHLTDASDALKNVFQLAPELSGIDRDVYLQRLSEKRALATRAISEMERDTRPTREGLAAAAKLHGISVRAMRRTMADALELSKLPEGTDLTRYMNPRDLKIWTASVGPLSTAPAIQQIGQRAMARAQAVHLDRSINAAARVHLGGSPVAALQDLRPGLRELTTKINAINAAALAQTRAAGVTVSELDDVLQYMRRQMTPEARKVIDKYGPVELRGIGREITEKHKEQLQRAFRGLTTTDVNDAAAAGKLSITGNHPVPGGIFYEDPFIATGYRVQHAAEASENATILRDYAKLYGQPEAQAPRTWSKVPSELAELQDVAFPPDIAAALTRQHEAMKNPTPLLKAWDEVHRVWKKYTLPIIPAYHGRNEIGDIWNAAILGGMDLRWFEPSAQLLFSRDGAQRMVRLGTKHYSGREILELADKAGAINTGQVASIQRDMAVLKETPDGVLRKLGDFVDHNAAIEWAQRFGQARENNTGLALFMDRMAKGYSPQAAALDVKKFLFHYGQVTGDEKSIMRLIPFYQWTRNNVPLQLQYLWRKPGAASFYQHARDEAAQGEPMAAEGEPLPRFLAEGLPFPAGRTAEGNPQFLRGESVIPLADLEMLGGPREFAQQMVQSLSPYLKSPYETATNVDLFRSEIPGHMQRLERAPGEASNYLGTSVPRRLLPLLDLIPGNRVATEVDRMNPGHAFGNEQQGPIWNRGLPRDYPDPDPVLRLLRIVGARPYSYRPDAAAKALDRDVSARQKELKQLRDDALDRGNTHNADRYQRELDRLDEKPERARQ